MSARGIQQRWPWIAAVAVLVTVVTLSLWRTPAPPALWTTPTKTSQPAPVQLINLGRNEAALTDPTPLFLPTEWNAAQDALPRSAWHEPGSSFGGYPAKLKFAETDLALSFPADVAVPARAADALGSGRLGPTYLGLGPDERPIQPLTARKAYVEVTETSSGQQVLAESLPDAMPPSSTAWQPMEFLVAVDPMGLVGPPILTESSRVATVDGYFQDYLVKQLHAGERLAPGFYRISVGP